MPVRVVDLLEPIQIENQQGQRVVLAALPPNPVIEIAEQETAVVDTRQLVLEDEPRGILPNVF